MQLHFSISFHWFERISIILVLSKEMNKYFVILYLFTISGFVSGQLFCADRESYKANKFIYEFHFLKDSTCFLHGYDSDKSIYFLYKGQLRKTSDTLYEYMFQPIVSFGSSMRSNSGDSLTFNINQRDTTILPMTCLTILNGKEKAVTVFSERNTVYFNGVSKNKLLLDTKFLNPFTKKIVFLSVNTNSEPELTYYGKSTSYSSVKISMAGNSLTIYPDHKHIQNCDIFKLKK